MSPAGLLVMVGCALGGCDLGDGAGSPAGPDAAEAPPRSSARLPLRAGDDLTWTEDLAALQVGVPSEIGFSEDGLPWVIGERGFAQATSTGRWQRRVPPGCAAGQERAVYGDAGGLRFLCYEAPWDGVTWASYRAAPDGTLHALVEPEVPVGEIPSILHGVIEDARFEEREVVVEANTSVHLFEQDDAGRLHVVTDGLYARLEGGTWAREALPTDDADRAALDPTTGTVAVFVSSSPSGATAWRRGEADWEQLPLFGFAVAGVTGFVLVPTTGRAALLYVASDGTDSLAVEEDDGWAVTPEPGPCEGGNGIAVADRSGRLHHALRCGGAPPTVRYDGVAPVNGPIDVEDITSTLYADAAVHADGRIEVVHVYGSDRDFDRPAGLNIGGRTADGGWWEETLLRATHLRGARMIAGADGTRHLVYWLDAPRVEGTQFHYATLAADGTFTSYPVHTAEDENHNLYIDLDPYTDVAPTLAEIVWDGERVHICFASPTFARTELYCAAAPDDPAAAWPVRLVGADDDDVMMSAVLIGDAGELTVLADEYDGTHLFEPDGDSWTQSFIEFPDRAALPATMALDGAGVTVICSTELEDTATSPSPGGPAYCGDHVDGTFSLHPVEPGGVSRSPVFLARDPSTGALYRMQHAPGGLELGTLTDSGWELSLIEYPPGSEYLSFPRFLLGFELIDSEHLAVLYVNEDYEFRLFTSAPDLPDGPEGGPDAGDGGTGGSANPSDAGGCGCSAGRGDDGAGALGLLLLALFALRRRGARAPAGRRVRGGGLALAVAAALLAGCGSGTSGGADAGGVVPGGDGGQDVDGGCTLEAVRTSPTRWRNLGHVAARDLDGDGDVDAVASLQEGFVVFDNDGEGALTESGLVAGPDGRPIEFLIVEDLDGDGIPDVLGLHVDRVQERLHRVFWRGLGDGTFAAFSAADEPWYSDYGNRWDELVQVVAADVVGDDLPDLVLVVEADENVQDADVRENPGEAPFFGGSDLSLPGGHGRAALCFRHADVDADGQPDVLISAWGGPSIEQDADAPLLHVALSSTPDETPGVPDSDRAYHTMTEEQLMFVYSSDDYAGASCPVVADHDQDGDLDVLVKAVDAPGAPPVGGAVANVLLNDGSGKFGPVVEEGAGAVTALLEEIRVNRIEFGADLDGDATPDLVGRQEGPPVYSPPRVSFGRGDLAFSDWEPAKWAGGAELLDLDGEDMNGDGLFDVVTLERVPSERLAFPPLGADLRVWSCAGAPATAPAAPPNLAGRVLESTSLPAIYFGTGTRTFGVAEGAYRGQYDFTYEPGDDAHATLTLTDGDESWELALTWSSASGGTYTLETSQGDEPTPAFGYQFLLREASLAEDGEAP